MRVTCKSYALILACTLETCAPEHLLNDTCSLRDSWQPQRIKTPRCAWPAGSCGSFLPCRRQRPPIASRSPPAQRPPSPKAQHHCSKLHEKPGQQVQISRRQQQQACLKRGTRQFKQRRGLAGGNSLQTGTSRSHTCGQRWRRPSGRGNARQPRTSGSLRLYKPAWGRWVAHHFLLSWQGTPQLSPSKGLSIHAVFCPHHQSHASAKDDPLHSAQLTRQYVPCYS